MLGALEREGTAVGVLADSLLRAATSAMYRQYLTAHNLTLVSPFNPEAGFNVGNAMARNRYIYCLVDRAVVISSSLNKGGTWHGAIEAMQAQWVPLWVMTGAKEGSGNPELIRPRRQAVGCGTFRSTVRHPGNGICYIARNGTGKRNRAQRSPNEEDWPASLRWHVFTD